MSDGRVVAVVEDAFDTGLWIPVLVGDAANPLPVGTELVTLAALQAAEQRNAALTTELGCVRVNNDELIASIEPMHNEIGVLSERNAELVARHHALADRQVEWLCQSCNTVFPSLSGIGPLGYGCKCGVGLLRPTSTTERELQARADTAESQLAELVAGLVGLADGYAAEAARHLMHAANKEWAEWVRADHSSRASELNGAAREIRHLAAASPNDRKEKSDE